MKRCRSWHAASDAIVASVETALWKSREPVNFAAPFSCAIVADILDLILLKCYDDEKIKLKFRLK